MELLIKDIQTPEDIKLFIRLARQLGYKVSRISADDQEFLSLSVATRKGKTRQYAPESREVEMLSSMRKAK